MLLEWGVGSEEWDKSVVAILKQRKLVPALTSVVEVKDWTREVEMIGFDCLVSTLNAALLTEEKAPWGPKLNLLSAWQAHLQVYQSKVGIPTKANISIFRVVCPSSVTLHATSVTYMFLLQEAHASAVPGGVLAQSSTTLSSA